MNINKWIKNNTCDLTNKTILMIGATGSLGYEAIKIVASLNANVIIAARNINKANKRVEELKEIYPNINVSVIEVDLSSKLSCDNFLNNLDKNNIKLDYFFNNAGIYHIDKIITKDNLDITLETNTINALYLLEGIIKYMKEDSKIIYTSSLSYRFNNLNYSDLDITEIKNKLKKYSLSKREMLEGFIYIKSINKDKNISFNLVHPGIVPTELFEKSHSKAFMKIIFPIMKIIFHSPLKGSLSLVMGLFINTKDNEIIGPRGLFNGWGYPKISKIKKKALKNNKKMYDYYKEIISNI